MNNLIYFTVLSGTRYRVNAGSGRREASENKINIQKNTNAEERLPKQIVIHNRRESKSSENSRAPEKGILGSFEFGGKRTLS